MCGLCAQTMTDCRYLLRQRRLMESRWTGDRDPYRRRVRACDEESASLSFLLWLQQMSQWSWAHWDWGINSKTITTARSLFVALAEQFVLLTDSVGFLHPTLSNLSRQLTLWQLTDPQWAQRSVFFWHFATLRLPRALLVLFKTVFTLCNQLQSSVKR